MEYNIFEEEQKEREFACFSCPDGEYIVVGHSPGYRETITHYECTECGSRCSFP